MSLYLMKDVVRNLGPSPDVPRLPASAYTGGVERRNGAVLGVESMRTHMTDEGWQIVLGLYKAGYVTCGLHLEVNETNVVNLMKTHLPRNNVGTIVVQDKREWDVPKGDFRDPLAAFQNIECLKYNTDLFKLTVLKDAHQRPHYHRDSAQEMGCHAWVTYYHPDVVCHVAPYVRREHLVRTYHTIDPKIVPAFTADDREGCVLSGAVSSAYPLRSRLVRDAGRLYKTSILRHPGYHRAGCHTTQYLDTLKHYKVSICTSSKYGYALRKIVESTAAGCVVVTDLPVDEVMPGGIDDNLVRVSPDVSIQDVAGILEMKCRTYDPELQRHYSEKAKIHYDYIMMSLRLAEDIEKMRCGYGTVKAG